MLELAQSGKLAPQLQVLVWHFAVGKPKDVVEMDLLASTATIDLDEIKNMTTEEMEAARTWVRKMLPPLSCTESRMLHP